MPSQICDLISKTMALLGKCSTGEQHPRPLGDFKASTKIRFSFFFKFTVMSPQALQRSVHTIPGDSLEAKGEAETQLPVVYTASSDFNICDSGSQLTTGQSISVSEVITKVK